MKEILQHLADHYEALDSTQKSVIHEMVCKLMLLQSNAQIEKNDWDYISLAIVIKEMIKQQ
jgi:hypothetical protein